MENIISNLTVIAICLVTIAMLVIASLDKIVRLFNLVDKRGFIGKESWQTLNVLMANGTFSIRSSVGIDGITRSQYLYIDYKRGEDETVSKSFHGEDINKMIDEAYKWAKKQGYLAK